MVNGNTEVKITWKAKTLEGTVRYASSVLSMKLDSLASELQMTGVYETDKFLITVLHERDRGIR
jgi:hypothetical protein